MAKKFVFESLNDFINYKLLTETPNGTLNEADTKSSPWDFKFDSGEFKKDDVKEDQLKKLEVDFKNRIIPVLNNPNYIGQKLDVSISSASSKVPVNPSGSVAKALKAAGYSPDNEGLCKARGNTVVELIKDLMYNSFGEGMDRKEFLKSAEKKMTFTNKPMPNIGPEYDKSKGDNPDDQKFKDNQYISATLVASGDPIGDDRKISCKMDKSFSGKKADASNGYAGYDKTVYIAAKAGQKMEIFFDPKVIPDAILFSYSGKEVKLSPFMGGFGAKYVRGEYSKAAEDKWNADAKAGKVAPAKREVIGGTSYLVIDYKDYINNVVNKGGVLVKAIEAKLASLKLKPIKELCPEFFDSEGKIEIYRNKDLGEIKITDATKAWEWTYDLLKSGKLKESPKADNKSLSISITKNAVRDAVTLVAFSPVEGTQFNIRTVCS
jgi:hypothetical protein